MFRAVVLLLSVAIALPMFQPALAAEPVTIVTLGDSITRGTREGVTANETFSHLLEQQLLASGRQVRVVNGGVGGETTAGALARLDRDVLALQPRIVVVMYGTNDCWVDAGQKASRLPPEDFERNLTELVKRLRAAGAEPIVMTEPCYAKKSPANGLGEHGNVRLGRYMEATRRVAARHDVVLVDNFRAWVGESMQRVDKFRGDIEDWTTDGYHPNPAGHAQIAALMFPPVAAAADSARGEPVDFQVRLEEVLSHDDGKFLWYHPRAAVFPDPESPRAGVQLLTLQKHLMASDHYDGLATMMRTNASWSPPTPVPSLAWRKNEAGETIAVCDVTPGYFERFNKVIAFGAKILYDDAGKQLTGARYSHQIAYAVYSPGKEGVWSDWQILELPDVPEKFHLATPGCAQWLVEDAAGHILLPIYHKGPSGEAYSVTVLRCSFDGRRLSMIEQGRTLELSEVRGLCEPSLARWRGRYYLTLRNDLRGYVTTSDDGLNYEPFAPWLFDDSSELGSYNTQQHWLAHSDGLFLVYTRRGANNDHIIRHRAPLFMGRVDTATLRVIRASEKIIIPERGGEFGNFGANAATPAESWVTVGEGVWSDDARKRGAKGTVFIAHIEWSRPNRMRGGSGPAAFVDQLAEPATAPAGDH
ncbi:MAG: SGNH/GDSL hydrolase family protein [Pirellulales bacterium]|nr:SGNH/GDSL hydrolase family protein [Pirellulales bacterium]